MTFTDPDVALTESDVRERWGDRGVIAESDYYELDWSITTGEANGFAKLVGDPRGWRVSPTIAAPGDGEAIAELTAHVTRERMIDAVSRTMHTYSTLAAEPARAPNNYFAARYSTPRVPAPTRPLLAAPRLLAR